MTDCEFDESLVSYDIGLGGCHEQGFGYKEHLIYNKVWLIDYEDMHSDQDYSERLDFKWVEGKRKFTIGNPNAGFDTTKVYDVWELYNEKKNSKK